MALLVHKSLEPTERDRASKAHKNPINYINAKWRRFTSTHRLVSTFVRSHGCGGGGVRYLTTRGSRREPSIFLVRNHVLFAVNVSY